MFDFGCWMFPIGKTGLDSRRPAAAGWEHETGLPEKPAVHYLFGVVCVRLKFACSLMPDQATNKTK